MSEVEYLSNRNEVLMKDMKQKDFFESYHQASLELEKLRDAHSSLINTIST